MVNRIKDNDTIDPNDIIGSVKDGVSRAGYRLFKEHFDKLMSVLEKIENKASQRVAFINLDKVLIGWAMAHAFSGEEACSNIKQLEQTIKTVPRREARSSVRKMRDRQIKMLPFVELMNKELAHVPFYERIKMIKKQLMENPAFVELLPPDLKDPRYIKKDIQAILDQIDLQAEFEDD